MRNLLRTCSILVGASLLLCAPAQAAAPRMEVQLGPWWAQGRWRLTGPVDAQAASTLTNLELRYRPNRDGPLFLHVGWLSGPWQNITFNGSPAPATVGGDVQQWHLQLGFALGTPGLPVDVFVGWQGYRALAFDRAVPIEDVANAAGLRLGLELRPTLSPAFSLKVRIAAAPVLNVTETTTSGTSTSYSGSLLEGVLGLRYQPHPNWNVELGWRGQRLELRRPTDVVDHTLEGFYLYLGVRIP